MILNFYGAANPIPTLSLADIYRCVETNKLDFLEEHLSGKIVLFGSVLDVEDRKLTSKRFITVKEEIGQTQRCSFPVMSGLYRDDLVRDTIPGVFVHATAINNLMRGDGLRAFNDWVLAAITFSLSLLVAALTMLFAPWRAAALTGIVFLAWTAFATLAFRAQLIMPLFEPLSGGSLVFVALLGYRVAVSDKDKRYLRRAFSYYLSPAVIERMISQDKLPALGGESREVTIMFSDIASFATLSEGLNASQVAHFLNEYLTEMSAIVETSGGYIEKFVADEITAVFGAPVDDPDHAIHATEAALLSLQSISNMRGAFGLSPDRAISARFGINSGEMLVGNIGSRRRVTYAAMGDAANLGSRLEGANKAYGTEILMGSRTAELCRDRFELREIDHMRVVGRVSAETIYEPLCNLGEISPEKQVLRKKFAAALSAYRKREFQNAAEQFEMLSDEDPVSQIYFKRARDFATNPPAGDWDGVHDLEAK